MNLFFMDFSNEIVLDGKFGPNGLALTNKVEKSYRAGVELELSYKVGKNFHLKNHSSYNYSQIKEQEEVFSPILTPPLIINQEAIYSIKHFSIAVIGRYQDKSFIDFANTSSLNHYLLLNSKVQYRYSGYEFCFFLNNLTNAKYFNNGYIDFDGKKKYFVQSPINFYASIKYSF